MAVLVAFGCQSIVTQSHVHLESDAGPVAIAQAHSQKAPANAPADCPICRNLAQAGHYLTPTAIVFVAAAALPVWRHVPVRAAWHGRRRSHAWHSRGPPALLQA